MLSLVVIILDLTWNQLITYRQFVQQRKNLQNCRSVVMTEMCSFTTSYWDACSSDIIQDNHNLGHSSIALVRLWLQFTACSERTPGHYVPSSSSGILPSLSWFLKIPELALHLEWQAACLSVCVWFVSVSGCVEIFQSIFSFCPVLYDRQLLHWYIFGGSYKYFSPDSAHHWYLYIPIAMDLRNYVLFLDFIFQTAVRL